ncbi:hypothetical protein Tco_0361706, partial [Tanacetum coccineum]
MMDNVLPNDTSAIELAIWLVTVGGHFKRDCPKLKNNNRGNQGGNGNASAKVYAVGRVGTNQDSNIIMVNSQIDITPSTLDHYYDVELANERIIELNAIIRG